MIVDLTIDDDSNEDNDVMIIHANVNKTNTSSIPGQERRFAPAGILHVNRDVFRNRISDRLNYII